MRTPVIVSAVRTPVGKIRGQFIRLEADELAAFAIKEAIKRADVAYEDFDEVIYGNVRNIDLKTPARVAAFAAGFPQETPAVTIERGCSSGLNAICAAATNIKAGEGDIYLAGGMEATSHRPFLMERGITIPVMEPKFTAGRSLPKNMVDYSMGITAENIAEKYGITRQECDEFGLLSQQRAAAAWADHRFDSQIVPVEAPISKKETKVFTTDETVRETSMEALAKLKPSFKPDGVCTAGNSSPLTDGAGAVVVMAEETAKERGLKPLVKIVGYTAAGCDPDYMGLGPVNATNKLLKKLGMEMKDIDLVEINEAFASQSIACIRELNMDIDKVNVNGGAIALGHPFGATGAILMTKIIYELERADKNVGLVTFCIGGGQGYSCIVERV